MQKTSICQKLRAFLHRKTALEPEAEKSKPVTVKPPDLLWAMLFLIGAALIAGVCWVMLADQFDWTDNVTALGSVGTLGLILFSWSLHLWIEVERSKKTRKAAKEQRIIEDREEAKADKAAAAKRAEEKAAEKRRLRNRSLLERIHDFIFGRKD